MKEEIVRVALDHFLKNGLKDVSVSKLATVLSISTKTFYKYFNDKESLVEETLHHYHGEKYKELEDLVETTNPICAFYQVWNISFVTEHNINKAFFDDLWYYYPELAEKIEKKIHSRFWSQFLKLIKGAVKEGSFHSDIIPEIVLRCIFTLYDSVIRNKEYQDMTFSKSNVLKNTLGVYIKGLCTVKGIEELRKYIPLGKVKGLIEI